MTFSASKTAFIFFFAALLLPFGAIAVSSVLNVNVDNAECKDTLDNDGDSLIDFPADPQCSSLNDNSEAVLPQCSDSTDNDGDTFIDFPADVGCSNTSDNDETNVAGGGGGGSDATPPVITTFSPADNAVNVSTTTNLVIDFNESVVIGTGNARIKKSLDGSTVQTIVVTGQQAVLSPNTRLTITSSPLAPGTSYYVELDAGLVKDGSGNSFAGLSGATSWNFTTASDVTPPIVSSLSAVPGVSFVDLSWKTNESAISSFFWGTTTDYATGSGAEITYSLDHTTTLPGLSPNTLYHYAIEARDVSGNKGTATGSFTTLPITDTTPPANPSGFSATAGTNSIALSWTNPTDSDFDAVKILRSTVTYPQNPSEGTLIYQGSAEETSDASVLPDVRYYYTIFARDASMNYSSGALASAIINSIPVEPPIPPIPPTPPPSGGSGATSSPTVTPSVILPPPQVGTTTPPIAAPRFSLAFADFDFFERGKAILPKVDEVAIEENNALRISLSAAKIPPEAKLFIVSIHNPGLGKSSSYLLNHNTSGTGYETAISPLGRGNYPVSIKIYDGYNRIQSDVNGILAVHSPSPALFSLLPAEIVDLAQTITPTIEAAGPVAVPVGIAVGVSQAAVLAWNVTSLYDLYLLFLKFIGLFTGFFRKKKPEPWGVVYDSVTKQPIDPAYIVVERTDTEDKKTAITDLDGRYGFLLSPGRYALFANKTHYQFPSQQLAGRASDELYDNLYFGQSFELAENNVVRFNVPLDPLEFDWNEFAKNKGKIFSLYSRKEKLRIWVFNALFFAGLLLAVYGTLLHPTKFNGAVLVVYGGIILFQALWKYTHKITRLVDRTTGLPVPFAIISVTVPGLATLIRKVVSDEMGRFYLMVSPGTYDVSVEEKQADGSYALIRTMRNVHLKKGVFTNDISVG